MIGHHLHFARFQRLVTDRHAASFHLEMRHGTHAQEQVGTAPVVQKLEQGKHITVRVDGRVVHRGSSLAMESLAAAAGD
ncbi:hypothetical protein D3C80_1681990 [compost metagenome]